VQDADGHAVFEADYTDESIYGVLPVDGAQLVAANGASMLVVDLAIDRIDIFNVDNGKSLSLNDVGLIKPAAAVDGNLVLEVLARDQRGIITDVVAPSDLKIISSKRQDFSVVQATGNDLRNVTLLPGLIHDFGTYGGGTGYQLAGAKKPLSDTEFYLYNDVIVTDARKNEGAGVSFDNFGINSKTIETGVLPEEFVVGFFQTGAAIRLEVVSVDPETGKETKGSVILQGTAMDVNTYRLSAQTLRDQGVDTQKVRILYAINPDKTRLYLHQYLTPQAAAQPVQMVDSTQKFKAMVLNQSAVAVIPTQPGLGRPSLMSLGYTFYPEIEAFKVRIVNLRFLSSAKGPLLEAKVEGGKKAYISMTPAADPNKKISLTSRRGLLTPDQKLLIHYKDIVNSFYEEDRALLIENLETGSIQSYTVIAAQSAFPLHTPQLRAIARTLVNNQYAVISTNHYQVPGIGVGFNRITVVTLADGTIRTVDVPVPAGQYTQHLSFISGEFLTPSQARIDFYNGTSYLVDLAKTPLTAKILPAVPASWKQAHSNPNYALRIIPQPGFSNDILQLLDLRSGMIQDLITISSAKASLSKVFDVSPDNFPGGPVVVYATQGGSSSPNEHEALSAIYVQRIADPTKKVRIATTEGLRAVIFSDDELEIETRAGNFYYVSNSFEFLESFYSEALLPPGMRAHTTLAKDESGQMIGWNISVFLKYSDKPGELQNQILKVRRIAGQWVIVEVQDRDFQNNLIARNTFTYNSNTKLTKITRTNKAGALLSTIHVRRPAGKAPYYEIVTALGLKENLSIDMPLFKVLKKAAVLEAQKPAPPPPAPAKPPSPLDLLKNLQNQLLGRLR